MPMCKLTITNSVLLQAAQEYLPNSEGKAVLQTMSPMS